MYASLDTPTIISGATVAYLDPQEKIWTRQSGKKFTLSKLQEKCHDTLAPFKNIAGFSHAPYYPKTLFRFPLRTTPSELSENIYSLERLEELIDALRGEANLLLPFLRSVDTIEVHRISPDGIFSLIFKVQIAESCKTSLKSKRQNLLEQLKAAHSSQSYSISNPIDFVADFHVEVTDHCTMNQSGSTHFLVAATVGSTSSSVCDAAMKQKVFPWVGTALQLDSPLLNNGRIFCFLPMPVDADSKLPVHVNGTFGLNDDRRSMKWPGLERRNDPTANWNELLVSQLLPPCYVKLLIETKAHIPPTNFYEAWPEVKVVKDTHWEKILCPLFGNLFAYPVLWSEKMEALRETGEWVRCGTAILTPSAEKLPSVLHKALSDSGLKLITVPKRVRDGLITAKKSVTEVSPKLARQQFRAHMHSYLNIDSVGKGILLKYCLKDKKYKGLSGIYLLPLANGNFVQFKKRSSESVYLCNSICPRNLLPNLDHILVDVEGDQSLHDNLRDVANSGYTQLTMLTVNQVAQLLPQLMPLSSHSSSVVSMADYSIPYSWFEEFWNWVINQNLELFENLYLLPVGTSSVACLKKNQAVIHIASTSSYCQQLLSAFDKLGVMYCLQSRFPYVQHQSLSLYVKQYNLDGILDSILTASQYRGVVLTQDEAQALSSKIAQDAPRNMSLTMERKSMIQEIAMFSLTPNSSRILSSPNRVASCPIKRTIIEPANLGALIKQLPNNLLLFSRNDHNEVRLLQLIDIESPPAAKFLYQYIFPLMTSKVIPDKYIDPIMHEVLRIGISFAVSLNDDTFQSSVSQLAFVRIASGHRQAPNKLFDPSNKTLAELYKGESVFPIEPYNSSQWLCFLNQLCGLRSSVTPNEILSIISTIKKPAGGHPKLVSQTHLSRAKAILKYISTSNFQNQATGRYFLHESQSRMQFSTALYYFASRYSWLPVLSEHPSDYPTVLPWKGDGYSSHFFTLDTQGAIITSSNKDSLPYIMGSQRYMTESIDSLSVKFNVPDISFCAHIIAHLQLVISNYRSIPVDILTMMMDHIYSYLSCQSMTQLKESLQSIKQWIYIRKYNQFVSPSVVAISPSPSFRHDLEPYIYNLPESLLTYEDFFSRFGVTLCTTQSQIIAALRMIKESIDKGNTTLSSSSLWSIVMAILNWLTTDGTKAIRISAGDQIYVPTESDSEWPQLMVASEIVYTDNDFLKKFLSSSDSDDYTFVHGRVSVNLAKCLGLTPLSDFLDITEDTFEDTGQYEPLTVRLKNILKDYKDGLTIAKELIQNADDAEATEINFCYDARTHSVKSSSLFFPEMLESHGPALLVHNNKTFSKDDFENITKLAGATKQNKPLKIGKFGIGFCSVYHITDVPSFVSRDTLTIFDPTMNHLKKEIKNPNRPGKKVLYTSPFIKRSKQLIPYEGLFGFNSQQEYNGTLFRLPFRSAASELSGTCYTESYHIKHLISEMAACSSNLILFLQHIKKITFQVIRSGESKPTITLEISKAALSMPNVPLTTSTSIEEITCKSQALPAVTSNWIVSNHSNRVNNKHATASVAASLLGQKFGAYTVDVANEGEIFCFLPLSQKVGLPVHINGNFAVISNRRGIWTSDDAAFSSEEICWNIWLMESVIPKAYYQLLLALQSMHTQLMIKNYVFYSCWPLEDSLKSKNPWTIMINRLYQMICTSRLFYSKNIAKWLNLNKSKFLAAGILCQSTTSSTVTEDEYISEVVKHLKLPVVHLPMSHRQYFQLTPYIISEADFLNLFFENLMSLSVIKQSRDQLILRMLEVYATEYDDGTERSYIFQEYFQLHACIPCAPDGTVLRKCNELIDPIASFAKLYDETENRFPLKDLTNRHLACTSLIDLGMIHKKLPYQDVVERAQTVKGLYCQDRYKAQNRIKLLLKTIDFHMKDTKGKVKVTLDTIPFLPVLSKPKDYLLAWAGDGHQLMCGSELMVNSVSRKYTNENNSIISGSQVVFLNENPENGCGGLSLKCQNLLNIRNSPTCSEVVCHLKQLIQTLEPQTVTKETKSWIDHACQQICRFLDDKKSDKEIKCIQQLSNFPCIWNGNKFLSIHQVAKLWKLDGPYLHQVPTMLSLRHNLCQALGIKEDFSKIDVENALKQMKQEFGDQPVNESSQRLLKELVSYFLRIKPDEFSDFKILLPDEKYVLMWSTDLAYNDAPWAPQDGSHRYVNDIIPRVLAKQLHVKPVRAKLLERYDNPSSYFLGVEFGQREELTRRIQNILRDYPFDITVLKELLQNADDAKATKMYVILDKRHHKTQSIISEKWQKLQGPALLVWNDSIFSEKDIKGIQELGLGSKRCEAESIGQYGIGFNSAYHLTDCPSFVSDGDILCVMDPHCTFVPGATPLKPGRRFDNLKSGFWDEFQDMKSAYLRSNLDNLPNELLGGSLFRFPLRSTSELVKSSKIAADLSGDTLVTSTKMEDLLKKWAPNMKSAMLFLNNVRELRFYIIQGDARIAKTQYHYLIEVSSSTQEVCDQFCKKVSTFKEERGCEPCIIRYPLTVIDICHGSAKYKEKWIIQQGVGDIERHNQTWTFVKIVKPRHGIAARLHAMASFDSQSSVTSSKLDGQVFCFLPLPISSHLPVHINGHFILNSTRRQLWQTTNPGEDDSKSIWNKNILSAIASSYVNFLKNAHQYYIAKEYTKLSILHRDLEKYYSVFPEADAEHLDEVWLALAKECYSKACKLNSTVLAVVKKEQLEEGRQSKFTVSWHPIKSIIPSSQVYFWYELCYEQKKIVQPVLEAIGMKVTSAPFKLRKYFNSEIKEDANKCPAISPSTVYMYYLQFFDQTASSQFPCDIGSTAFKSVENFKIFTRYILQRSTLSSLEILEFPTPPFGCPLLLTADGKLRKFDEHNKVIFSQFAVLFPYSNDCFIHSSLLDIKYTGAYFVIGSQSDYCNSLIHRILADNLPQCLCDIEKYNDARSLIPLRKLQLLWLCFSLDPVFGDNLASILNRWALILTTDNRFFSNACQLHPILPLIDGDEHSVGILQVLVRIGMPVVNTSVVTTVARIKCPVMSQPIEVLNSLFYLAQDIDLSASLTSSDVRILIGYLCSINYRTQPGSQHQVKSLPLFENIVDNFVSLSGLQAFIWPMDCTCIVGYKIWIRIYPVVFLKQNASWSQLCSPDELQIQRIETEDMYVKFIFPHFHLMSESERYEHLRYIRDNLYYINNVRLVRMHHVSVVTRQRASSFITALKLLQCIGKDGHPLFQVSDFCDHEQRIFTTFSQHFKFLPDYFTSNQQETPRWMDFFRGLGLKTNIAHEEFIEFCTETANGQVANVREASSVLIESLFNSKQEWHGHPGFLTRVSRIGFLCSEKLLTLTWITSSAQTSRRIQSTVSEYVDMTEPCNAATMNCSTVLWTVKPIVSLPDDQYLLQQLSVCTEPLSSDVVKNLCNICTNSQFTDVSHFDKYHDHLRPPENGKPLSSVFLMHLYFLQMKGLTSNDLCTLQNLPCIPVYASPDSSIPSDIVLVKPQAVLTTNSAADYYPFLHQLPDEFSYLINLLERIGVKKELNLKHMQMVLESAYKCSGGKEIDPNTNKCVVKALKFIYKMLRELKEDENRKTLNEEQLLSPLYLPSRSGTLILSTHLLYHDEPYFYGRNLDLGATEYTELDMAYSKYEFYQSQFCSMLPLSLRPKGISKLCSVKIATECEPCDPSDIAKRLSSTLKLSILPKAVVTTVKHKAFKDKKVVNDVELQPQLDDFLKRIKVVTYKNLKLVIVMKETMATIGKVKVPFYLEKNEPEYTLYLDTALNGTLVLHMFSELADLMVSSVQHFCNAVVPVSIQKTFEYFLMAESAADLIQELQRRCLPIADVAATENVTLSVGMEIPQDWHYRLDQDINNKFHANEYVGYEDEEGHIIVVKIVHVVVSENEHDSTICQFNKRYLVFTSEDDEIGTEVGVLSLYKFTKGALKNVTHHSHSVVPYTGDVDASIMKDDTLNLKSVKKEICEELKEIWHLDLESRKKALRRLYLKWHPDRNPDNPDFAEKVFKFLLAQIDKLERRIPLDDPEYESTASRSSNRASGRSTWWDDYFREWDQTAHQHQRFRARDYERSRPGRTSANVGGWSSASPFSAGDDNFRVPRQPQEGHRWMLQANTDHEVMMVLYKQMEISGNNKIAGHVCFLSHQVAEKSLKAGMYAICGLDEKGLKDHALTRHAYALQTERPLETQHLAYHTSSLENFYLDTRYPNRHIPPSIPATVYTREIAQEATKHATNIYSTINSLFDS